MFGTKNKTKAFSILCRKLYSHRIAQNTSEVKMNRITQLIQGERSRWEEITMGRTFMAGTMSLAVRSRYDTYSRTNWNLHPQMIPSLGFEAIHFEPNAGEQCRVP